MTDRPRIVVVDDGLEYSRIIEDEMPEFQLVKPGGSSSHPRLPDGPSALSYLEAHAGDVDLVLLDMDFDVPLDKLLPLGENVSKRRTKRFQGVAILREIRKRHPGLPVVLLTAVEDLSLVDAKGELASQSMTYFLDGDDLDTLRIRINTALKQHRQTLEESEVLWGEDQAMRALRRRMGVLAFGTMPVILEGETGTGKSFLARKFLYAKSGRKGPFVVLDLASIPSDLVPAHLFGARRGAYTGAVADRKGVFEMASGGVLFIDEVQNIPIEAQKQLLLVLQEGRVQPLGSAGEIEVDVKVVAATSSSLEKEVLEGRFRSDLYMRLCPTTRVEVPPLRKRKSDLRFFAERFVEKTTDDPAIKDLLGRVSNAMGLEEGATLGLVIGRKRATKETDLKMMLPKPVWSLIEVYDWPGNMRELETVMRNIVTFTLVATADAVQSGVTIKSRRLQVDPGLVAELLTSSKAIASSRHMALDSSSRDSADVVEVNIDPQKSLNAVANSVERQYFIDYYKRTGGDFSKMAGILLGDTKRGKAVRLRFNQLGLKVKEISSK